MYISREYNMNVQKFKNPDQELNLNIKTSYDLKYDYLVLPLGLLSLFSIISYELEIFKPYVKNHENLLHLAAVLSAFALTCSNKK